MQSVTMQRLTLAPRTEYAIIQAPGLASAGRADAGIEIPRWGQAQDTLVALPGSGLKGGR